MKGWLCFLLFTAPLAGQQPANRFEGYYEKTPAVKIASFYLPYNPVIVQADVRNATTPLAHSNLWPAATIYAFASQPLSFETLVKETAHKNRIIPLDFALNAYSGTAPCYFDEKREVFTLLAPLDDKEPSLQTEVYCVNLDSWAESYDIQKIDLLWLTMEGAELPLLKHSPRMLRTLKVLYTQTHFLPFRKDTTQFQELKTFLERAGFVLHAHWYQEGVRGTALFLKKEIYEAAFFKGRNP